MKRIKSLAVAIVVLGAILAALLGARSTYSQYAPGGAAVKGTVKLDGKTAEGVTVSVRGEGKTFISTVFTNAQGAYLLPRLEKGKYDLWAQAVGYAEARTTVNVADGPTQQAGTLDLKPMKDFHTQLSSNEWIASLPETSANDLRMKEVLIGECTGCHQIGYPLQNRFDEKGWNTIVTMMTKIQGSGGYMPANPKVNPVIEAYREEIVAYLARVRGPNSPALTPKVLPRPTGEAANVVVTEFDLPRPEQPDSILTHNGSVWSDGIPSRYSGRASHDVVPGPDGNAYFSDDVSPVRTMGKIDTKTGKVTDYKVQDKDGNLIGSHGIAVAPNGFVWVNAQPLNTFMSFDPETQQFHNYPRPEGTAGVGGNIAVDSKGNLWASTNQGAVKLDPKTGVHSFYKAELQGGGTYGITIDSEDKAWFASPGMDSVWMVDLKGRVSQVKFPPKKETYFTDKDRELTAKFIAEDIRVGGEFAAPLTKGPRRMSADPKGNYVWVADTFGDMIERIDIHTNEVKEYSVPRRWSEPYAIHVDKNHMVWINLLGRDAFARLDPNTEQFTEFQLPTRGTESRWIRADNTSELPTIWIPYNRVNRVARIQFRKTSELQSQLQ